MQHFYTAQNLLKYSLVSLKKHSTLAISYRLGFFEGMIATFCQNLIKFSQIVFHIHSSINSLSDLDRGYLKHDQNQPSPSRAAAEPGLATLLWFQGRSPDSQGYKEGFNTRPGRNETLPLCSQHKTCISLPGNHGTELPGHEMGKHRPKFDISLSPASLCVIWHVSAAKDTFMRFTESWME